MRRRLGGAKVRFAGDRRSTFPWFFRCRRCGRRNGYGRRHGCRRRNEACAQCRRRCRRAISRESHFRWRSAFTSRTRRQDGPPTQLPCRLFGRISGQCLVEPVARLELGITSGSRRKPQQRSKRCSERPLRPYTRASGSDVQGECRRKRRKQEGRRPRRRFIGCARHRRHRWLESVRAFRCRLIGRIDHSKRWWPGRPRQRSGRAGPIVDQRPGSPRQLPDQR